jgi:hypothetical protein
MLALTTEQQEALAKRHVMRRLFIWCEAKDPDTGDPAPAGFWDDVGDIEYFGRTYHGSGNIAQVATLAATGDLTIPGLSITLSGIASEAAALVRGETVGQAPISVKIGIFDVDTHTLIEPLVPFFDGKVDDIRITTPEAGGTSTIELVCESTSRALTIKRTDTRSDASCRALHPNDAFYSYTGVQRDKPLYFGRVAPK